MEYVEELRIRLKHMNNTWMFIPSFSRAEVLMINFLWVIVCMVYRVPCGVIEAIIVGSLFVRWALGPFILPAPTAPWRGGQLLALYSPIASDKIYEVLDDFDFDILRGPLRELVQRRVELWRAHALFYRRLYQLVNAQNFFWEIQGHYPETMPGLHARLQEAVQKLLTDSQPRSA